MSATGHRGGGDERVGDPVPRASEQASRPVREELRPAQAEMARRGRRSGPGGRLFGGAGLFTAGTATDSVKAGIAELKERAHR